MLHLITCHGRIMPRLGGALVKAYVMGQVNAVQMGTHNMRLYKKVDKKYTGCNLNTTELFDSALIGLCVVIRSNMVCCFVCNICAREYRMSRVAIKRLFGLSIKSVFQGAFPAP